MACMFDLRDILQLVVNGFNYCALAQHQLIEDRHQLVFHVLANLGHELYIIIEQKVKQRLRDIAFVSKKFTEQVFNHLWYRSSVIDIARGELNSKQFTAVIDNEM